MNPYLVFSLSFFPSAIVLIFSFFIAPAQYSFLYTRDFLNAYLLTAFFSSTFLSFCIFILKKSGISFLRLFSFLIKFLYRAIPSRFFTSPFYPIVFYLSLQLLERLIIGFNASYQGINTYNANLSSLPFGFKAFQVLVFIFALFTCYRLSFTSKIKSLVNISLLGLFSLLTFKRLLLLVCLFYAIFLYIRNLNLKSLRHFVKSFKVSKDFLFFVPSSILIILSFYYLFGFVDDYRNLRLIEISSFDLVRRGWTVFSFYIQMPVTNFASYIYHDASCKINFLSTFLPNRFLDSDALSCTRDYQIYYGTVLGFGAKYIHLLCTLSYSTF